MSVLSKSATSDYSVDRPTREAENASLPRGSLTVVVPVYNEVATVDILLERVLSSVCPSEVIIVDDGSTDGTTELLKRWHERSGVLVLRHHANGGKGTAIRTGIEYARGEFLIVQDADLEYDPAEYPRLLAPLREGLVDVVYGSRRMGRRWQWKEWLNPFFHGVSSLNVLTWYLYGVLLTDEATCYKATSVDLLRAMTLECKRFEFCPEVTAKALRMHLRIVEIPISYERRSAAQGKKIRFRDWLQAVATLWKWRSWQPGIVDYRLRDRLISQTTPAASRPVRSNVQ